MSAVPHQDSHIPYGKRLAVDGGVEVRSRRGGFGTLWWSRQLAGVIEQIADRGRITRGRNYARAGQVVSYQVERGRVSADVQGSQPRPFASVFTVSVLDDTARAALNAAITQTPGALAALAAGTLPPELGPALLPAGPADIDFGCTCPDPGWPCKHAVAVGYVLAEHLERNPLDLLTLRGIDLGELMSGMEHATADDSDYYGDRTVLPTLPEPGYRPAPDDLDTLILRGALRMLTPNEQDVRAALHDLNAQYEARRHNT